MYVCVREGGLGGALGVDGVGRPCPPVRNDIVTLRHLFDSNHHGPTGQLSPKKEKQIKKTNKFYPVFLSILPILPIFWPSLGQ